MEGFPVKNQPANRPPHPFFVCFCFCFLFFVLEVFLQKDSHQERERFLFGRRGKGSLEKTKKECFFSLKQRTPTKKMVPLLLVPMEIHWGYGKAGTLPPTKRQLEGILKVPTAFQVPWQRGRERNQNKTNDIGGPHVSGQTRE